MGDQGIDQAVVSALSSRYISIVLFPYYLALGAQVLSSLYALVVVPETLRKQNDHVSEISDEETDDDENETVVEALVENVVEPVVEAVTVPVKPLALLLPHRGKHGALEWRLFILTMSLLATTSGVSAFSTLKGNLTDCQTVFIATASLLFLSDKFHFNPEAVSQHP